MKSLGLWVIFFTWLTSYVISAVGFKQPAFLFMGLQKHPPISGWKHTVPTENLKTANALLICFSQFSPGWLWGTSPVSLILAFFIFKVSFPSLNWIQLCNLRPEKRQTETLLGNKKHMQGYCYSFFLAAVSDLEYKGRTQTSWRGNHADLFQPPLGVYELFDFSLISVILGVWGIRQRLFHPTVGYLEMC